MEVRLEVTLFWYRSHCFCHVNQVVLMLTRCIYMYMIKSEQGHLHPFCHSKARLPRRQLWNGLLANITCEMNTIWKVFSVLIIRASTGIEKKISWGQGNVGEFYWKLTFWRKIRRNWKVKTTDLILFKARRDISRLLWSQSCFSIKCQFVENLTE